MIGETSKDLEDEIMATTEILDLLDTEFFRTGDFYEGVS
jgi:hypothetical protein